MISGVPRWALLEIDTQLSYPVKGAWFSKAYRNGRWDGRVHMIKVVKRVGYTLPTGLLPDLLRIVRNLGVDYTIENRRKRGPRLRKLQWITERKPRPYQRQAVRAVFEGKSNMPGLAILKMPIRSGKTLTAALLIRKAKLPTLFVVPSTLLLTQTVNVFRECFGGIGIGEIGKGSATVGDVTVATYQSLMTGLRGKSPPVLAALADARLLIIDECHHLEAEEWRKPLLACPAYMRIGLSATAYIHHKRPNERSAIWLKACCGPIVYDVDMAYMVRKGWLVPTTVEIHPVEEPKVEGTWDSALYDKLITNNKRRNAMIVRAVKKARKRGQRVLVDIGRVAHGRILERMMSMAGLRAVVTTSRTDHTAREVAIADLVNKRIDVLISTLLGEGVDIPELEVVVNAEGMASRKATIQRLRNMTPAEGKKGALVIEFADLTNPYLARHTESRLKAYKSERCFRIVVDK